MDSKNSLLCGLYKKTILSIVAIIVVYAIYVIATWDFDLLWIVLILVAYLAFSGISLKWDADNGRIIMLSARCDNIRSQQGSVFSKREKATVYRFVVEDDVENPFYFYIKDKSAIAFNFEAKYRMLFRINSESSFSEKNLLAHEYDMTEIPKVKMAQHEDIDNPDEPVIKME